jgi:hypothetical protein
VAGRAGRTLVLLDLRPVRLETSTVQSVRRPFESNKPLVESNRRPFQSNRPLFQSNRPLFQSNRPLLRLARCFLERIRRPRRRARAKGQAAPPVLSPIKTSNWDFLASLFREGTTISRSRRDLAHLRLRHFSGGLARWRSSTHPPQCAAHRFALPPFKTTKSDFR